MAQQRQHSTTTDEDISNMIAAAKAEEECKNTKKSTQWAVNAWNSWARERNSALAHPLDSAKIPRVDQLHEHPPQRQARWLAYFACEVRTKTGQQYSRYSLEQLVHGIHREMRKHNPDSNILEDLEFKYFQDVLQGRCKQMMAEAKELGTKKKIPALVTAEQEASLWDQGVLNTRNGMGLLRAVFFGITRKFGVYSGLSHAFI